MTNRNIEPTQWPPSASSFHYETERQGFSIIEHATLVGDIYEPYVSPYLMVGIVQQGEVEGEYDLRPFSIHRGDMFVVLSGHIVKLDRISPDYHSTVVMFTRRYCEFLGSHTDTNHMHFLHNPVLPLRPEQMNVIPVAVGLLRSVILLPEASRERMLGEVLCLLSHLVSEFATMLKPQSSGKNTDLFNRFYDAITQHFSESREVKFYADLLCLSPKHFSTVIRQATGINAGHWIARYITVQAKSLLRYRHDLTIQQISHQLGFADQTAFSRYFRNNTGLSPKKYREQNRK